MTNPNDAVGTNAAYGGRTSTNAFNDDLAPYNRGVLSGWACVPNAGLTVSLGGDGSTRDVAVAEDNAGNKTTINNISGSPIDVTMAAAPASNSRIDAVVAYVDNPAQGSSSVADNPAACGIIAVQGTAALTPSEPSENQIRTAITADGASGTTAYYVVLAYVTIASGTTDIVAGNISGGEYAGVAANNIDFSTFGFTTTALLSNYTVTTTRTTVLSVTVPTDGQWFVILSGFAQSATGSTYYRPCLMINSTEVTSQAIDATAGNRKNITETYVSNLKTGDVVSLEAYADNGTYLIRESSRLSILRVG